MVANIDVKKYEGKRTAQYFNNTVISDPRADFKPSLQWQTKKCEEFGKVATRAVSEKKSFLKNNPDCKKTTLVIYFVPLFFKLVFLFFDL